MLEAKSIQLKVRFSDFTTSTRNHTYREATNLTEFIWQRAKELLDKKVDLSSRKVRLIGLAVFNLGAQRQMELFVPEKMQRLEVALEKMDKKYGKPRIRKGRTL